MYLIPRKSTPRRRIWKLAEKCGQKKEINMSVSRSSSAIRLLLAAVVIIFGAYWAGGRWGARQPVNVQALPRGWIETRGAEL